VDGLKGIPESVTRFAGKRVEIVGYLFPTGHVDGPEAEMWGAVNESGPAPDINQTVHVTVPEGACGAASQARESHRHLHCWSNRHRWLLRVHIQLAR